MEQLEMGGRVDLYHPMLAAFSSLMANPGESSDLALGSRVVTKRSFDRICRKIKAEVGSSAAVSNTAFLTWLVEIGLVSRIETDRVTFFLLEMGGRADSSVSPFELLMAFQPAGFVCHFSAIAYHGLSSQPPSHHHVALASPTVRNEMESDPRGSPPLESTASPATKPRSSLLGVRVFRHQGLDYHLTRRSMRLAPGVQTRLLGPRSRIRITTLEQTLLDTLRRPVPCGGPSVSFEAWNEAIASHRLDEERLVSYLKAMNYPSTDRRVGAMLNWLDASPGRALNHHLTQFRETWDRDHSEPISLLTGLGYDRLNPEWMVTTP